MKSIPNKNNLIPSQAYLPAEWHAQSGVQLTWPHAGTDWEHMLHEVEECYLSLAREIAQRTILLISSPEIEQVRKLLEKSDINMKNVRLFECSTNDTWTRDHGAITMLDGDKPYILDFTFNGWGLKFASCHDNLITRKLCKAKVLNGSYINALSFVLEGGGIESDGEGTLLTTSHCLLSDNRNEEMSKEEIEAYLIKQFNLKQVLWLDYGYLAGDDTDSHIDTLARLCPKDTIAYVKCNNEQDEHFEELKKMEKQLQGFKTLEGNPYKLIALPMADEVIFDMERLPATYANFLIMDQVVLYPTYNQPKNDKLAKQALQEAFPNLEIIGIDCSPLIKQHGSLHCVTMQYPVGVLR
ncbi:agmatine deiminase family protein [Bacteroides propionicifaciens]|uniref:agmatine deiminase family protein n=1 Tax=Bacteroides propionicifaciens TaxID=392838 RepID=UPI00039EAB1A|nr:agmatine deiminase family protein [Bacteroides propionicifaciens]